MNTSPASGETANISGRSNGVSEKVCFLSNATKCVAETNFLNKICLLNMIICLSKSVNSQNVSVSCG